MTLPSKTSSLQGLVLHTLVGLVLCSTPTNVQAEVEVRLEFVSFNDDLTQYVVVMQDNQQGRTVQIRDTQSGAIKKSYFVTDPNDEQKRLKRLKRKFPTQGHIGQVGPKERHTIMGAPDGRKGYDVLVKRGNRFGTLQTIPLKLNEETGTTAVGMLKTVVWAPSGRFVLAILNQTIRVDNDDDDIDDIHYIPFKHWKIKWFKQQQDGSGGS